MCLARPWRSQSRRSHDITAACDYFKIYEQMYIHMIILNRWSSKALPRQALEVGGGRGPSGLGGNG